MENKRKHILIDDYDENHIQKKLKIHDVESY